MKAAVITSFDLPPHYGDHTEPVPRDEEQAWTEAPRAGEYNVSTPRPAASVVFRRGVR